MTLSAERLRELLFYDHETGLFLRRIGVRGFPRGVHAGSLGLLGYVYIGIDRKKYPAHRLAWLYVHGEWPRGGYIDHINGDKSDNRLSNLRSATQSQNSANIGLRKHNTSGLKGAHFDKYSGKWKAQIMVSGRIKHLGRFGTPEEAHAAYVEAAKKYFGEYVRVA